MAPFPRLDSCTVAVIGLGYVGLPLAVEFAKRQKCHRTAVSLSRHVIGFDINELRLKELGAGFDRTLETSEEELRSAEGLEFTSNPATLVKADVYVVTVPTPIDASKRPDLSPLEKASATVGRALKARAAQSRGVTPLVIFESTVYPGATEEVCIPILERESGLRCNADFACGYSPERINPGDKQHRLSSIVKVTSGSTPEAAEWVDQFYGSVIKAGTHRAASLKVAEAAKVIENTQRDLNIALINELAMIFARLGIDTLDVLEAAGSKWNFLPFRPGLVGGHCIGVDPYYLTYKAEQVGYYPQVVLAGRRINDSMGEWIVQRLVVEMARRRMVIGGAKVLVMGLAFKENCPDLRNSLVVDVIRCLRSYNINPLIVDPWVDLDEAQKEHGLKVVPELSGDCFDEPFDAVIAAVAHRQFASLNSNSWKKLLDESSILFDLKGMAPRSLATWRM